MSQLNIKNTRRTVASLDIQIERIRCKALNPFMSPRDIARYIQQYLALKASRERLLKGIEIDIQKQDVKEIINANRHS